MKNRIETVIIMGAAGRDFHNYNVYFRGNHRYHVVAFTATQIPDIDGRRYPAALAGSLYPEGIPIHSDKQLRELIEAHRVDLVAFSYSDVTHAEVMHKASIATAAGADFIIVGAPYTMIESTKPVVSVCAVRTGCGKSQTSRKVIEILQKMGKTVVAVRHPMPYGDLTQQVVQRFASYEDLETHRCTIEEREEYEPHIRMGVVAYAGVDYEKILRQAETEADIIVWDGGNNDTPFYKPDLHIVLLDPHRPGHETAYHPGETNLLMADVAIINKVDSATPENVAAVRRAIEAHNPSARIVLADSELIPDEADLIRGKRVLVVEDGPTLTHGNMAYGAGVIACVPGYDSDVQLRLRGSYEVGLRLGGQQQIELWESKADASPTTFNVLELNEYAFRKDTFRVLRNFFPFWDEDLYFEIALAELITSGTVDLLQITDHATITAKTRNKRNPYSNLK